MNWILLLLLCLVISVSINSSLICSMSDTNGEECCTSLVPYVKPVILREFFGDHRNVTIGGRMFRLHQDWQRNGVAGVIWDSGIVLARYISEHPELVANRTVLELGAGLGLPSIISTYQNAKLIHVTDRLSAVSLLGENVRQNANNDCDMKIFAFDWNIDKLPQKYQVILGADLIYGGITFEPLVKLFEDASDHDTVIYLCSKIRYERDQDFYRQLLQKQFDVREIFYETEFAVNIFEIKKLANYCSTRMYEEKKNVTTDAVILSMCDECGIKSLVLMRNGL
uniref:Methyltransferase n=1 Tax=Elaeophora elaphi TaxID=1147741 RepID=A0A0R3RG16_9BILA